MRIKNAEKCIYCLVPELLVDLEVSKFINNDAKRKTNFGLLYKV